MKNNDDQISFEDMSFWQRVFSQSKLYGARYEGESLPHRKWEWPKDTFLRRRLPKVIAKPGGEANG